jgi:hypothetical protein
MKISLECWRMLLISFDEVYSVCWMADGDVSLEQQ